jgi:SAM-dependent methyltransferase
MPATPCPVCQQPGPRLLARLDERDYLRCRRCAATFLPPDQRPDREAERREYELHCNAIDDPGYRAFLDRLARPLLERLDPGAEGLDYGCGPGPALAAMLREAGHPMALWDPLFVADPGALGRSYDFIVCTEVIEHLHHPRATFGELAGLLRPGGLLGLTTCFQTDDARFVGWHYRRDPTHVLFWRRETLRYLAAELTWSIEFPADNVAMMQRPAG